MESGFTWCKTDYHSDHSTASCPPNRMRDRWLNPLLVRCLNATSGSPRGSMKNFLVPLPAGILASQFLYQKMLLFGILITLRFLPPCAMQYQVILCKDNYTEPEPPADSQYVEVCLKIESGWDATKGLSAIDLGIACGEHHQWPTARYFGNLHARN